MTQTKVCLIGQFPPPIHGLSVALNTLYNSELKDFFPFEKIDITDNKKIIQNIVRIKHSDANLFYLTISQSKMGNLRDLLILRTIRKMHKKCVVHLHGGMYFRTLIESKIPKWQKRWVKKEFSNLSAAIVLSPSLKENFKGFIPEDRIFVVPNCADDSYICTEEEFKNKLETQQKKIIKNVLYLSNFIQEKGYLYVLNMALNEKKAMSHGKAQTLHFDFAGKFYGDSEKVFFSFLQENHLEDIVTYHGIVTGQQKKNLFLNADFFVLLTSYHIEGQPISIIEAMANGCEIISSDKPGISDFKNYYHCHIQIYDSLNFDKVRLNKTSLIELNENRHNVFQFFSKQSYLNLLKGVFLKSFISRV